MPLELLLVLLTVGCFAVVCLFALVGHVAETLINRKRGF